MVRAFIKRIILSFLIMTGIANILAAKPAGTVSLGLQAGFLATGFIADLSFGPFDISAGLNIPLGWTYMAMSSDLDAENLYTMYLALTADALSLSPIENVSGKVGISILGFTDFKTRQFVIVCAAIRKEYVTHSKQHMLFVSLNVPVVSCTVSSHGIEDITSNSSLPKATLFTSTIGILRRF